MPTDDLAAVARIFYAFVRQTAQTLRTYVAAYVGISGLERESVACLEIDGTLKKGWPL